MSNTVEVNVIQEAVGLAAQGAIAMAQQQRFAALHLDASQARMYLRICLKVRQGLIRGEHLWDAISGIFVK